MGKKISQYTQLSEFNGNEEIVVAYNGTNLKFKVSQLRNYITKESLGLDKVDNTPDLEKPLSQLMVQALQGKANLSHNHTPNQIQGLDQFVTGIINGMNLVTFGSEW